MKRIVIACLASFWLGACASQAPQIEAAQLLTAHATNVQRELGAFAQRRTAIDKERYRNAQALLASALETEDFDARTVAAWSADRKQMLKEIQASTAESAKRSESAAAALKERDELIASTKSLVATRSDELSAAAKALSKLAQRDKLLALLKFYRGFAAEVKKGIEAAREESEKAEASAKSESAAIVATQVTSASKGDQ